jgi:riboflavin synthase alpha subunit
MTSDHVSERESLTLPTRTLGTGYIRRVGAVHQAGRLSSREKCASQSSDVCDVELAETQALKGILLVVVDHRDAVFGFRGD